MHGRGHDLPLRFALVAALACGGALAPAAAAAACAAGGVQNVGTANVRLAVELSRGTLTAHTAPNAGAPALRTFGPRTPEGVTRVFLVRRRVVDARCAASWYQVDLPIRPNGVRGWVPASGLRPYVVHWRIRVELARRRLIAYEDGRERLRLTAAIGRSGTPTPTGSFYVFERLYTARRAGAVRAGRARPLELLSGAHGVDARRAGGDSRHGRCAHASATPSRTAACGCATSRCRSSCASSRRARRSTSSPSRFTQGRGCGAPPARSRTSPAWCRATRRRARAAAGAMARRARAGRAARSPWRVRGACRGRAAGG